MGLKIGYSMWDEDESINWKEYFFYFFKIFLLGRRRGEGGVMHYNPCWSE